MTAATDGTDAGWREVIAVVRGVSKTSTYSAARGGQFAYVLAAKASIGASIGRG